MTSDMLPSLPTKFSLKIHLSSVPGSLAKGEYSCKLFIRAFTDSQMEWLLSKSPYT
jgi:hypothetical protein